MCNIKKVILSISISFIMLGALIMGIYLNSNKSLKTSTSTETLFKNVEETNQIYYAANEITVKRGGDQLGYTYIPDSNLKEGEDSQTKTIAYEYIFTNPMDRTTGVNLKYIDTTGVKVSYLYSNQPIDTEKSHTADTEFELQELESDESLYVYIIVSPLDDEIPATFNPDVVWYCGIPLEIEVYDGVTNESVNTQKIISGQPLDDKVLVKPEAPTNEVVNGVEIPYTFNGWYKDEGCTQLISEGDRIYATDKMYARYSNLPSDWLALEGDTYYVKKSTSQLPENLVIPSTYNGKRITYIKAECFQDNTTIKTVELSNNIKTIYAAAFKNCTNLTKIQMQDSVTGLGANGQQFYGCTSLKTVILSKNLTTIPTNMFYHCTNLSEINIPTNITSIGDYAFTSTTSLSNIDLSVCTQLESIGKNAFACDASQSKLQSIGDLSKCVKLTTIDERAFMNCSALSGNCVIPASVTKIGQRAFRRAGYTTITFANTSGWWVTTNTDYTGGTELTSADLVANSTKHLKETYYTYYWRNE